MLWKKTWNAVSPSQDRLRSIDHRFVDVIMMTPSALKDHENEMEVSCNGGTPKSSICRCFFSTQSIDYPPVIKHGLLENGP